MSEELAWAAGLFDGEGSTGAYPKENRGYRYLRLAITQNDRLVLDRFVEAVGVGKVYGPYFVPSSGKKNKWSVQTTGEAARLTLEKIWPWLSPPKRQQAERAFAAIKETPPKKPGSQARPCEPGCSCAKHTSWDRRRAVA